VQFDSVRSASCFIQVWVDRLAASHHRHVVAQPCVNGDRLSKGRMAKFNPAQIRNPSSDEMHTLYIRTMCPKKKHPRHFWL